MTLLWRPPPWRSLSLHCQREIADPSGTTATWRCTVTTDQPSSEEVQRVTDDLGELWLRLHRVERRLGAAEAAQPRLVDQPGEEDEMMAS